MRHKKILALILFLVASASACSRKLPADLPKLYSCRVTISAGGSPVEDAMVTFIAEDSKWSAIGTTDSAGAASLQTNGRYPGVAAGQYKVTVQKYHVIPRGEDFAPEEISLVDPKYSKSENTILACMLQPGKGNFEFEVEMTRRGK